LIPESRFITGAGTKLFMETADETSINRLGEHDYRTFRTGSKLKISSLEVCPIHVDHSIPGAYGFIIYTSAGTLVYTGICALMDQKRR
jgi:ribonuclease J